MGLERASITHTFMPVKTQRPRGECDALLKIHSACIGPIMGLNYAHAHHLKKTPCLVLDTAPQH